MSVYYKGIIKVTSFKGIIKVTSLIYFQIQGLGGPGAIDPHIPPPCIPLRQGECKFNVDVDSRGLDQGKSRIRCRKQRRFEGLRSRDNSRIICILFRSQKESGLEETPS